METKDKQPAHPIIETRIERVKLPRDIEVEAHFDGRDYDANRLIISTPTSRVTFCDKEQVRMFAEAVAGLRSGHLTRPYTQAELDEITRQYDERAAAREAAKAVAS